MLAYNIILEMIFYLDLRLIYIHNQYLNISIINVFGHLYYVKIIDQTQIKCSLKIINPTSIWD